MKRRAGLIVLIAGGVVLLDLITKYWATEALRYAPPRPILGDFVRFSYVRNSGVAFGLGAGIPFPYFVFSLAAIAAILYLLIRRPEHGLARSIALALILGGALGNLIDRLRAGEVVDFIDVGVGRWRWPVFNVADSAVTIGVVMFALAWPHHRSVASRIPDEPSSGEPHEPAAQPVGADRERGAEARPLPGGRPN